MIRASSPGQRNDTVAELSDAAFGEGYPDAAGEASYAARADYLESEGFSLTEAGEAEASATRVISLGRGAAWDSELNQKFIDLGAEEDVLPATPWLAGLGTVVGAVGAFTLGVKIGNYVDGLLGRPKFTIFGEGESEEHNESNALKGESPFDSGLYQPALVESYFPFSESYFVNTAGESVTKYAELPAGYYLEWYGIALLDETHRIRYTKEGQESESQSYQPLEGGGGCAVTHAFSGLVTQEPSGCDAHLWPQPDPGEWKQVRVTSTVYAPPEQETFVKTFYYRPLNKCELEQWSPATESGCVKPKELPGPGEITPTVETSEAEHGFPGGKELSFIPASTPTTLPEHDVQKLLEDDPARKVWEEANEREREERRIGVEIPIPQKNSTCNHLCGTTRKTRLYPRTYYNPT